MKKVDGTKWYTDIDSLKKYDDYGLNAMTKAAAEGKDDIIRTIAQIECLLSQDSLITGVTQIQSLIIN